MNLNRENNRRIFINNELVLVETPAQVKNAGGLIDGTLTLTSNHLMFRSQTSGMDIEVALSEINSVKVFQFLGFISKGIKCYFNTHVETFLVDFPKDWVRLILRQQNNDN